MDEGWAAVAAGVSALVGAVASGWYTGRSARQGAEKAAAAVLKQVADQGAVEHGHWLRGQRQEAYLEFLSEWDASIKRLDRMWDQAVLLSTSQRRSTDVGVTELRAEVDETTALVTRLYERVAMLGPDDVETNASLLQQHVAELGRWVWLLSQPSSRRQGGRITDAWHVARRTTDGLRPDFLAAIRGVLQSPPRPAG
ncbi:hypothetical protein [Streptomyces sp. JV180]|uniref:hypothetical protein n=1 Tax=Streptomyces sp. JV180 TaxID=858634 RepID=UPI00168B1437|nr:hypothetical protein [Streptomyces sp. JV180]MBD3549908.1 hypothetical protein [Streptomyces sp. JV180]